MLENHTHFDADVQHRVETFSVPAVTPAMVSAYRNATTRFHPYERSDRAIEAGLTAALQEMTK